MQLTFVCSGNTCRSPLAVAAWQVVAREMNDDCCARLARVIVNSAGLNAQRGATATAMAQLITASWNVDLSEHRARIWHPDERTRNTQLLVAMTTEQAAQIRFRLETQKPRGNYRVEVLGSFIADQLRADAPDWDEANDEFSIDIPDPYGGSSEAYEECAARVLRGVRALAASYCRD